MKNYFYIGMGIILISMILLFPGCNNNLIPTTNQSEIYSTVKDVSNDCLPAPAIAQYLLQEAGYSNSSEMGNLIQDVAKEMGLGTDFHGISKCDMFYTSVVALFLIEQGAEINYIQPEGCFDFDSTTGTITDYDVITCGLDVSIPPTISEVQVEHIGYRSFYEKGLTSVIIPRQCGNDWW